MRTDAKTIARQVIIAFFAFVVCGSGAVARESGGADEQVFDRRTPTVLAYQKTYKAVVNIAGRRQVATSFWPNWDDWFGPDLFAPRYQRVLGSGMVVHEDGYVITNAHVIKGTDELKVTFSDGSEYDARPVSADEERDLAVLKIDADRKLPFIHLGTSGDLMIGETVIAIGNPLGYAHTLTEGVISAIGRDIEVYKGFWLRNLIQTDAPINPGNSGGPLLNINGELIGINTAINPEAQNIGFAIPVDTLAENLIHMLMPEELRRVRLGLVIGRLKTVNGSTGLVVDSVVEDSPADEQGIKPGDLLLEIDGGRLTSFIDFYVKMMDKEVSEPIEIEYIRPAEPDAEKKLARLSMAPRPLPDGLKLAGEFFQMETDKLNDRLARKFGFASSYPVMIVTEVAEDGQAAEKGIEPGDVILEVNGSPVGGLREFSLQMEKVSEGEQVDFLILRIQQRGGFQLRRRFVVTLTAEKQKQKESLYRLL